jgi:hypothetical protein
MIGPSSRWVEYAVQFLSAVTELTSQILAEALDQPDVCGPWHNSLLKQKLLQCSEEFISAHDSAQISDAGEFSLREIGTIVIPDEAYFKEQCHREEAHLTQIWKEQQARQVAATLDSRSASDFGSNSDRSGKDEVELEEPLRAEIWLMATFIAYYSSAGRRYVENVVLLNEHFLRSMVQDLKTHIMGVLGLTDLQKGKIYLVAFPLIYP